MTLFSRLCVHHLTRRHFSTVLAPDSKAPLSSKQKTRAALSLIKFEENPEKIIEICRAASLTPDCHLDRIAFSAAVSKLSKSNNFSFIQQFLDELRTSRPDLRTERFASHAIVLFGQANMLDHAIRTFNEYHDELNKRKDFSGSGSGSVNSLNALLFASILAKNYGEMKRIFVEFPQIYHIQPNLATYNTVIKGFAESGSSSSCYSVLAEMNRKGVKPNATSFGNLLSGFYREKKFEDVEKVLRMMKGDYGIHSGLGTYNIRIQSLCKLKKSQEAKLLLEEMLSKGMKPNSDTYCHLIHGFCKEGDLEEAKRLFKSMVNKGCKPSNDCYFTLIHYLCQGGEFESALRICKESIGKGWVPNFSTMKSLVNGLASVGKVEEAKELIGQVKEKFTKNVHLWEEVEAGLQQ